MILTQESLESDRGIQSLENAAVSLYKALQAGRDTGESARHLLDLTGMPLIDMVVFLAAVGDMAAAIERMQEYQTHNAQFTKRIFDYLFIMFKFQVSLS